MCVCWRKCVAKSQEVKGVEQIREAGNGRLVKRGGSCNLMAQPNQTLLEGRIESGKCS